MTLKKLLPNLLTLIVGLTIGYFVGARQAAAVEQKPRVQQEPSKPSTPKPQKIDPIPPSPVLVSNNNNNNNNEATEKPKPKPNIEKASPDLAIGCFASSDQLALQLTLFAEQLEKQALMYNNKEPEKLLDCSGIFHRTAQFVNSKCSAYKYPDPKVARDTRSLAKWYHKQQNLTIITDPLKQRSLIRPGAVLFFGNTNKVYQPTIAQVTAPYPTGIVGHMGVVTAVKKDDQGNVIGYVMFHGRRPGKTAERSHYHSIKPPRLGFPILGNWNQQWIGVANIMSQS